MNPLLLVALACIGAWGLIIGGLGVLVGWW